MHPGRWHHTIGCALGLAEAPARPRDQELAECLACLDTVLEVFPRSVDPVDDEPGYAVRALAKALRARLEALAAAERGAGR